MKIEIELSDIEAMSLLNVFNLAKQQHAQIAPDDDQGMMSIMALRKKLMQPQPEQNETGDTKTIDMTAENPE